MSARRIPALGTEDRGLVIEGVDPSPRRDRSTSGPTTRGLRVILLDTNVRQRDAATRSGSCACIEGACAARDATNMHLSLIAPWREMLYGVRIMLKSGPLPITRLQELYAGLTARFGDRILPIDALGCGGLADAARRATGSPGRMLPLADGLIAATALVHDLTLWTRNTRDFDGTRRAPLQPLGGLMDFALSDEQTAIRDMARDFGRERIAPHAQAWEAAGHHPARRAAPRRARSASPRCTCPRSWAAPASPGSTPRWSSRRWPMACPAVSSFHLDPQHVRLDDRDATAPTAAARPLPAGRRHAWRRSSPTA